MRSVLRWASLLGVALGVLGTADAAFGQTRYVYPNQGGSGFRGYTPGGAWVGPAPGSAWTGYVPGRAWSGYAPGTPTVAPSITNRTAPAAPRYTYVPAPVTTTPRLRNGFRNPVPGPNPYADGRSRAYLEYGTGRTVPLGKPWLPGSPG